MKRMRYSDEQIVRILRETDKDTIVEVARRYGVSEASIYAWRKKFGTMQTDFVLDALDQALYQRRPHRELIHHSDRGSQYISIRYSERLVKVGIDASVGSVGDAYDNALAETIHGLYKTEVIHRKSWPDRKAVEMATLQ